MSLNRIVVATDESEAGRSAARVAYDLAVRGGARQLTFVTVKDRRADMPASGDGIRGEPARRAPVFVDLVRWLDTQPPLPAPGAVEFRIEHGIPSIEICRFAEERQADLLVLGRKPHSQANRMLLGDTADSVARRSIVPTLHVPANTARLQAMLVALDGSERSLVVFRAATGLARAAGLVIRVVTVEPARADEPLELAATLPGARSTRLLERLRGTMPPGESLALPLLDARRGDVVEQVLAAVAQTEPDVLVLGTHRGGAPGVMEAGSVTRRLAHTAPCALFMVPL
ncbi:MAG: universal stress protein [Gemmatimonadales bacterium]